jgi:hypothetical protein
VIRSHVFREDPALRARPPRPRTEKDRNVIQNIRVAILGIATSEVFYAIVQTVAAH